MRRVPSHQEWNNKAHPMICERCAMIDTTTEDHGSGKRICELCVPEVEKGK